MNTCRHCGAVVTSGQEAQRRTAFGIQRFPHYHQECWKVVNASLGRRT